MQKTKTQKGITLTALVITVIVMLILAGVSVTVALNGGIFSTARQAADETQLEIERKQLIQIVLLEIGNDGKVNFSELDVAIAEDGTFEGTVGIYTSKKTGNTFTVNEDGDITLGSASGDSGTAGQKIAIQPRKTTYTMGEEVRIGNQHFFVIADSTEEVTLLAKYNLSKDGTAQQNAAYSETACRFSRINYWSADATDGLDLNTYPIPTGEGTAITTAKKYGLSVTGNKAEGRLLRKDEVNTLKTSYSGIIYGDNYDATSGYLMYWLGSAVSSLSVWRVSGNVQGVHSYYHLYDDYFGVRPVIEISKSDI